MATDRHETQVPIVALRLHRRPQERC